MSSKSLCLFSLFVLSYAALFAQTTLSGKVLTQEGKAFADASVTLLSMPDSVVYARQKTDQQGAFSFQVDQTGKYRLHYTALGF